TMDKTSRTLQVRVVLPNPKVVLKPGMFATVRIHTQPAGETLVVPAEAVIHSGERTVVFVSLGNGRFDPRDVKLGVTGDEKFQVLSGVKEGEAVVTSGEFLLDSESRLKEAVEKMLGSNVGASADGGAAADGGH
ncbi:MAG: efflux RND transporter periplasmic adaptor subunit, partial [Gemmatimonadota bacterium]